MCPNSRPAESAGHKPTKLLAALLAGASTLILMGFLWPGMSSWLAQALLVTAMPVLLILLGCSRSLSRALLIAMGVLWSLLVGSWAALIWLDGEGVPSAGGIPLVLWILVCGLVLLPLALVSWAYAATFTSIARPSPTDGPRQRARSAKSPDREIS
jgi:hypothetical protein